MIIECDTYRFINEVIKGNEYSFALKDLVVVDVGCNIGTFSFWIHSIAKEVHAIDLSQENIDLLKKNIQINTLSNIFTYCMGISDTTGIKTVNKDGEAGGGGWKLGEGKDTIPTMSLNDFLTVHDIRKVDLLKVDVEGEEINIIASNSFPYKKIRTICGEFHQQGEKKDTLRNTLEEYGYTWTEYPGNHFLARL